MPAKKPTAKKAAKKAVAKKTAATDTAAPEAKKKAGKKVADIVLDNPDTMQPLVFKKRITDANENAVRMRIVENVRKSIDIVSNRSKTRRVSLMTPAMLRKMLFTYDDLYFQYMLGAVGFRTPSVMQVIAPDSVGKTTFCFDMIGRICAAGCYVVYIECEDKMMSDKRIKRILHRDKKTANILFNQIVFSKARQLVECDNVIRQEVEDLRKRCDASPETKGNPIFVFVDTWTTLKSSAEAKGQSDWGLAGNAKKEAVKDTGTGSNFGHSKHASGMKRWLPEFNEKNNCTEVFFCHQNERTGMNGPKLRPGMPPPPESTNDTATGGRGMKQIASYRWTMMKGGPLKDASKKVIGFKVNVQLIKNAYGEPDRRCGFSLYYNSGTDTPKTYDDVITYCDRTAEWMASAKLLGTTVKDGLYTCDTLGCVAVGARELYSALLKHPEHIEFLGAALEIEGYESEVAQNERERLAAVTIAAPTVDDDDDEEGGEE